MSRNWWLLLAIALGFFVVWLLWPRGGSAASPSATPKPFDARLYMGTWHERARMDSFFEPPELACVTATYGGLTADNSFDVVNRGVMLNCEERVTRGRASPSGEPGQFLVSFPPYGMGDYRILDVQADPTRTQYTQSIVGSAKRDLLWVLMRDPKVEVDYERVWAIAKESGYSDAGLAKLRRDVPTDGCCGKKGGAAAPLSQS